MLPLPRRDDFHEFFEFKLLDFGVDGHEALAQHLMQVGFAPEPVEGFTQTAWQAVGRQVSVTAHFGFGFDAVFQAQIAASQGHGEGHIGVGIGPDDAVFHAPRLWSRNGRAYAHGAVVMAPFDVDGGGGVAGQPPVAVDIRRYQSHGGRDVALQSTDEMVESLRR